MHGHFSPPPPSSALHPSILWAQRTDTVFLTLQLTDVHDEKLSLEESRFKFEGVGGTDGNQYSCELQFLKEIIPQVNEYLYSSVPFVMHPHYHRSQNTARQTEPFSLSSRKRKRAPTGLDCSSRRKRYGEKELLSHGCKNVSVSCSTHTSRPTSTAGRTRTKAKMRLLTLQT